MKLSDYVFRFLRERGVSHVFLLSGGGIMHLVDSLSNSGLEYVCCHHEQACAIAAQAYGMYKNDLGVCLVTTGPGGTNALTGVAAAYMDSTPVLFLSGQVKRGDFASLRGVRQFGAQENDIISMARPVTKYAALVEDPKDIRYHLEKAVHAALEGRRGPAWLDIPLDVQDAEICPERLRGYRDEASSKMPVGLGPSGPKGDVREAAKRTCRMLSEARRPVFLVGHGLVASGAVELFHRINGKLRIPTLATWRALEVYDWEDGLFFGSPGLQAPRYSNLIQQGADFVLVLGSRLDNMITAFNEEHFAYRAKKVVVDIDAKELEKLRLTDCNLVQADVGEYLSCLEQELDGFRFPDVSPWAEWCGCMKQSYPLENERQDYEETQADLYAVTSCISEHCQTEDTLVVSSTSRCNTAGHIAFRRKAGQRSVSSMGMGSMGFALPSVVGAWAANGGGRVVMLEGDGSLQLNIQELQTIVHYGIDAKMFIFCNSGYAAIATMQDRNFGGHHVGSTPESGVSMPSLGKVAGAYGIPFYSIASQGGMEEAVRRVMAEPGAVLCEVRGSMKFDEIPKCISSVNSDGMRVSAFLENPYPFLPEEEVRDIYAGLELLCERGKGDGAL